MPGDEAGRGGLRVRRCARTTTAGATRCPATTRTARLPSRRGVYFAGDTDLFPEMAELAGALDVALLPVSGWGPKSGPGHMDPREAAEALALVRPRLAVPIHWGTLRRVALRAAGSAPARAFADAVAELAPDTEVRILQAGESMAL